MTLQGELQAPQVNALWQRRDPSGGRDDALDMSGVTTLDSAGLALLVKWAKATLARGARRNWWAPPLIFIPWPTFTVWPVCFNPPRPTPRTHNASL